MDHGGHRVWCLGSWTRCVGRARCIAVCLLCLCLFTQPTPGGCSKCMLYDYGWCVSFLARVARTNWTKRKQGCHNAWTKYATYHINQPLQTANAQPKTNNAKPSKGHLFSLQRSDACGVGKQNKTQQQGTTGAGGVSQSHATPRGRCPTCPGSGCGPSRPHRPLSRGCRFPCQKAHRRSRRGA